MVFLVAPAMGAAATGAGMGAGMGAGLGSLALIYTSTALYAGFWGLGALWVSSFKKFGGPLIDDGGGYPPPYDYEGYGGGYGGGHGGGYGGGYEGRGFGGGGYGGGYAPSYSDSYSPPKSSKGKGGHGHSYSSKGKGGYDHDHYSSKGKGGYDHDDYSSKGKGGYDLSYSSKGKGGHDHSYSSKGKGGHDHSYSSKKKGGHDHSYSSKGNGGHDHSYSSKGKGGHDHSYSSKGKGGHDHVDYLSKGKEGHDHGFSSQGKVDDDLSYSPPKSTVDSYSDNHVYTSALHKGFGPLKEDSIHIKGHNHEDCYDGICDHHRRRRRYRRNTEESFNLHQGSSIFRRQTDRPVDEVTRRERFSPRRLVSPKDWVSHTEPEEEQILRAIRDSDTDNCGLKLVCELAAIWDRPLTREEWEILRFVRDGDALFDAIYPGQGVRANSEALRDYKEAVQYGEKGGACTQRFRTCRVGAAGIMETLVAIRQGQRLYL